MTTFETGNVAEAIPIEAGAEEGKQMPRGIGGAGFTAVSLRRLGKNALPSGCRISRDCLPALAALVESEIGEVCALALQRSKRRTLYAEDLTLGLSAYQHKRMVALLGPKLDELKRGVDRLNHALELEGYDNGL